LTSILSCYQLVTFWQEPRVKMLGINIDPCPMHGSSRWHHRSMKHHV